MMMLRLKIAAFAMMVTAASSTEKTDLSCFDGDCVPSSSASLLQKVTQQDKKTTVDESQPETENQNIAPTATPTLDCAGTSNQNRCWHLSEMGESCVSTCNRNGRVFSFSFSDPDDPITPDLVHHEPKTKQEPWAALECYSPSEDRYHPANKDSLQKQKLIDNIGNWSHENCKLACPCGGWLGPAPAPVPVPATAPTRELVPATAPTRELVPAPAPAPTREPTNCGWQAKPECKDTFEYKGIQYTGCILKDHPVPWCSYDSVHKGFFDLCTWVCDAPAEEPTNTSGKPCDRNPDTDKDFIGDSVTLDEVGYKIVTHVPSADSAVNMKRFICRIVDDIGCKVKDNSLESLSAFVPLFVDHSYSILEYQLFSLCKAGDGWVVSSDGSKIEDRPYVNITKRVVSSEEPKLEPPAPYDNITKQVVSSEEPEPAQYDNITKQMVSSEEPEKTEASASSENITKQVASSEEAENTEAPASNQNITKWGSSEEPVKTSEQTAKSSEEPAKSSEEPAKSSEESTMTEDN